jgi:hypothetical protein
MTTPNDNGQNNDNKEHKLTETEAAIIDILKKQSLESGQQHQQLVATSQGDKKHLFWDTQVRIH